MTCISGAERLVNRRRKAWSCWYGGLPNASDAARTGKLFTAVVLCLRHVDPHASLLENCVAFDSLVFRSDPSATNILRQARYKVGQLLVVLDTKSLPCPQRSQVVGREDS